jgi:thioesterase domain-containing protein
MPFDAPTVRQFAQAIINADRIPASPLVEWPGQGERPFFYFHGDYISGGLYVRRLAERLGDSARLISVAPHGLGHESIPETIEQMARERLALILAAQPIGPFRLGGHCNGGTVAFEVARLLRATGHSVALLTLVDVPMMNASIGLRLFERCLRGVARAMLPDSFRQDRFVAAGMELIWMTYEKQRRFLRRAPSKRRAKIVAMLRSCQRSLLNRVGLTASLPAAAQPSGAEIDPADRARRYFRALASYVPQPLNVPILYFSAEHSSDHVRRITPHCETVTIPGDHFACVTTHMYDLADRLRERLGRSLDVAEVTPVPPRSSRHARDAQPDAASLQRV